MAETDEHFELLKVSLDIAKNELDKLIKRHAEELKTAKNNIDIAEKNMKDYLNETFNQKIMEFIGDAPVVLCANKPVSSLDDILASKCGCSIFSSRLDENNIYISDDGYITLHVKDPTMLLVSGEPGIFPYAYANDAVHEGFAYPEYQDNRYLRCGDFETIQRIYEMKYKDTVEYYEKIIAEFITKCDSATLYLGKDGDGDNEWYFLYAIKESGSCYISMIENSFAYTEMSTIKSCENKIPTPGQYDRGVIITKTTLARYNRLFKAFRRWNKKKYLEEIKLAKQFFDKCVEARNTCAT